MHNSEEDYGKTLQSYSQDDLFDISRNMDKEAYPERYERVLAELERRGHSRGLLPPPLSGIGGWLILALIGLIVSPFLLLYTLFRDFQGLWNFPAMALLQDPASSIHVPYFSLFMGTEIVFNLILLLLTLWTLRQFLRKKRETPRLMIAILAAGVAFEAGEYVFSLVFLQNLPEIQSRTVMETFKMGVRAAFWIPYFLKSERVRNTFVE